MNNQSEQINELMTALSKAQGKMSAAAKDSNNPYFNSKYADLSSVWNACREALSMHGLAVVQTMNTKESGEIVLVTTLGHSSGQWICSSLPVNIKIPVAGELSKDGKPKKVNELQLLGSCLTYLRRYALAAMVGVAPDEDDDGNSVGRSASYSKKEEELTIQTITKKQAEDLSDIIEDCDPVYKKSVMEYLKKNKVDSLDQLPTLLYDRVKNAAIKKRDEFILSQASESQNVA